jgi:hypothetical protein
MPVFISYSHKDKEFAEKLSAHLVRNNAHVWMDTWELNVGDSIVSKVQEAIREASALLIVLSKSSVISEWCKKELNAGFMRELEEKRVVVLPILLEDCAMPTFLKEKMYADFRTNFDKGLQDVLDAISKVTNCNMGRLEGPKFYVDWAVDWYYITKLFNLRFTLIEHVIDQPFTILTEVMIQANDTATKRYQEYEKAGLDWVGRAVIVESLVEFAVKENPKIIIDDQFPKKLELTISDPKTKISYDVMILCRRLGQDTGKDILLNLKGQLEGLRTHMRQVTRKTTPEETARLAKILSTPIDS